MSKASRLICTIDVGNNFYSDFCLSRIKKYAHETKSNFHVITKRDKFHPWHLHRKAVKFLKKYSYVLYMDLDIVIEDFDQNIFHEIDNKNDPIIYAVKDYIGYNALIRIRNRFQNLSSILFSEQCNVTKEYIKKYIFNGGVTLLSQKSKSLFKNYNYYLKMLSENKNVCNSNQAFLNLETLRNNFSVKYLDPKWNCLIRHIPPELNEKPVFLHYAGKKEKKILKERIIKEMP